MTEKEKKQEETQIDCNTVLIPWYFSVKYQGIQEQYYSLLLFRFFF